MSSTDGKTDAYSTTYVNNIDLTGSLHAVNVTSPNPAVMARTMQNYAAVSPADSAYHTAFTCVEGETGIVTYSQSSEGGSGVCYYAYAYGNGAGTLYSIYSSASHSMQFSGNQLQMLSNTSMIYYKTRLR